MGARTRGSERYWRCHDSHLPRTWCTPLPRIEAMHKQESVTVGRCTTGRPGQPSTSPVLRGTDGARRSQAEPAPPTSPHPAEDWLVECLALFGQVAAAPITCMSQCRSSRLGNCIGRLDRGGGPGVFRSIELLTMPDRSSTNNKRMGKDATRRSLFDGGRRALIPPCGTI